jgi:hypothetical protein
VFVTVSGYVEFETLSPVSVLSRGEAGPCSGLLGHVLGVAHHVPKNRTSNKLQRKSDHTARLYDYVNCS